MFAYSPEKAFPEPTLGVFNAHSGQQQRIDLPSRQNEAAKHRPIKGQVAGGVLTAWAVKCFIIVYKIPELLPLHSQTQSHPLNLKQEGGKAGGKKTFFAFWTFRSDIKTIQKQIDLQRTSLIGSTPGAPKMQPHRL